MSNSDQILPYLGYTWVVHHPDLLGGQPTIKGTRISVSQVLECLSVGMSPKEIAEDYEGFPIECIFEVLKFASEHLQKPIKSNVAA